MTHPSTSRVIQPQLLVTFFLTSSDNTHPSFSIFGTMDTKATLTFPSPVDTKSQGTANITLHRVGQNSIDKHCNFGNFYA